MPVRGQRSRNAKEKRYQGHSGFAKRASASSPDASVYCLSDNKTDASTISSSDKGRDDQAASPMEGLQRLYSVFLPPHLQLNEDHREKRQKVSKRSAMYTRDSRTTAWRRNVAQRKAAEGCATLDGFVVQRKVGSDKPDRVRSSASHHRYKRQRSPSPLDSEDSVVHLEDLDARDTASVQESEDLDAETFARSAEHTAAGALLQSAPDPTASNRAEDLPVARPVAQSAADLIPDPAASIDDAIDQITAELAAFCFEQLERSATSHDALDLNTDASVVENELRVRYYIARRPNQYI
jgi:hypothetical protein